MHKSENIFLLCILKRLFGCPYDLLLRGSYGHEKTEKVKGFENAFSRPGKVVDLGENGRGHGKATEFHFLI